jgi:hypothetical protein
MTFFAGMPLLVIVQFFLAFVILLGLFNVTAWAVRGLGGDARPSSRLVVIDCANVDRCRRLILVRRDNVEHLVMIGGPTDIVVESNFARSASAVPRALLPPPEGAAANRLAPRQSSRPRPTAGRAKPTIGRRGHSGPAEIHWGDVETSEGACESDTRSQQWAKRAGRDAANLRSAHPASPATPNFLKIRN